MVNQGRSQANAFALEFLILVGLLLAAAYFCVKYFGFTLDDAYITFRYAEHFAAGEGITWNANADPVEGYSSTMWMVLAALSYSLEFSTVASMKLIGVGALLGTVVGVYTTARFIGVDRWAATPVAAMLAFNPAMAVLAVQGLETTTAMLFVFLSAVAALRLSRGYDRRWVLVLYSSLLLGILTRPGVAVYAGGLLTGLMVLTYWSEGAETSVHLLAWGVIFLLIPGIVYIAVRTAYFGYPLPNSFYVKEGDSLFNLNRILYVIDFIAVLLAPLAVATLALALRIPTSRLHTASLQTGPLFAGIVAFLAIWLFVDPIQAYLWRFLVPIAPAVLLVIARFLREVPAPDFAGLWISVRRRTPTEGVVNTVAVILLAIFLTFQPLHLYDEANRQQAVRGQSDRVQMGKALQPLANEGYRMLISQSGAVPYHSGWNAIDDLGLNSERIAHEGPSVTYFREYNPNLVMTLVRSLMRPYDGEETVEKLVTEGDYRLAAVVRKSGPTEQYHAYFVDADSAGYQNITCATRSLDDVSYVATGRIASFWESVHVANVSCR